MAHDGVLIDARRDHPTVIFLQDPETRFTLAVSREHGDVIGVEMGECRGKRIAAVWDALYAYQRELDAPRRAWWARAGYSHIHTCSECKAVSGCYAEGCGVPGGDRCGACAPADPDIVF